MKNKNGHHSSFPTAAEDAAAAERTTTSNATYRLAYSDRDFLLRDELRSVRLQLEWLKPDLIQDEQGIASTVVIFGSARFSDPENAQEKYNELDRLLSNTPDDVLLQKKHKLASVCLTNSRYYVEARNLSKLITELSLKHDGKEFVVVTGGGPGIMEAANRGAADMGGKSIGLNIVLPFEQTPNPFITDKLCFQFHYFAIRKMHFLKRARALIACPGGFGTLDELLDALTLIQTGKIEAVPIILLGRHYWENVINFTFLLEQGAIAEADLELFDIVDTAEQAWEVLQEKFDVI